MDIFIQHRKQELDGNYCLVLTSNSIEKQAVKDAMGTTLKAKLGQDHSGAYLGLLGESLVLHISGEAGISRERSIGRIANAFLRNNSLPKPRAVLLVGFCWGNPANTSLDAVIVSNQVWCANIQHAESGAMVPRGSWQTSALCLDMHQERRLHSDLLAKGMNAVIGPIASAETLYMDSHLRDRLIRGHPGLLGGEMEAFAFISSDLPWLVVKTVSDTGGDDFNRERQAAAAELAAQHLAPLLHTLDDEGVLLPEDPTKSALLKDIVEGNHIEFDARHHGIEQLNDVLDGKIGPRLEFKLKRYVSPNAYGADFMRHCVNALLELIQNAIRHGRANRISLIFDSSKITLSDDGNCFDPTRLREGGRGGSHAMRLLLAHAEDGAINFEVSNQDRGNLYAIHLPHAHAALETARRDCAMYILEDVVGVPYGHPALFEFAQECNTLYLDTTPLRMSSRKYCLADGIKQLVATGKTVYVGCGNIDDVRLYKDEFRNIDSDRVIVFLDVRLFSP